MRAHTLSIQGVLGDNGLVGVARRFPTLQIVLDHCGGAVGPTCFDADPHKRAEWEQCMTRLAAFPNVALKVGAPSSLLIDISVSTAQSS
jgi:predicted TIM-barrel fold metal-dependent hydrolase